MNAAVLLQTSLSASGLLKHLHAVEARFGRNRAARWAPRTLDLDLLFFDDLVLPDPEVQTQWRGLAPADQARLAPDQLILPHPRLQDRGFVLVPLADIAADWHHPVTGTPVSQMLAALSAAQRDEIRVLPG